MDKYLVIGDPIEHSISPEIHTRFASDTGQKLSYTRLRVKPADFTFKVDELIKDGIKGMNITLPLKELAFAYADTLSLRAELAGAVNTFKIEAGQVYGDNTDGAGLVRDLKFNLGFNIKDIRILLLGAGGAAKGILKPLLDEKPSQLHIANRTPGKAFELQEKYKSYGNINASGFLDISGKYDLIINATSASVTGDMPDVNPEVLGKNALCYDLMYAKKPTAFINWSHTHGAISAVDGLGMLVEQAAESFYLWRGVRPKTRDLIFELKA